MKTKVKIIAFILITAIMLITLASCGDDNAPASNVDLGKDREGNSISLPGTIEKIISIGPSNTELLVALGVGGKIIATDEWSGGVGGLNAGIPLLPSITEIDGEFIIDLQPDIIIVTGMSKVGGNNPLQVVEDTGICVIVIPSSTSIDEIKEDIRFIAAVAGAVSTGNTIVSNMEKEIADIKKIGDAITDKKSVYFEISPAPWMYSFGNNTFLNEMIEIIGAVNIFADQDGWMSVADEQLLDANPDVILTTTNWMDDAIGEIKGRPGWDAITAVQNNAVYYIDQDASNRPNHNIVKALKEMAKAVYPDKYN
jgi:iron complex transport system substrate-binding protein